MKIDLGTIVNSQNELQYLFDLPVKAVTAFRISKHVAKCKEEIEAFNEFREKLVNDLGETVQYEDGSSEIKVLEENYEKFFNDLKVFLDQEVNIDATPISIEELVRSNGESLDLTPFLLEKLSWLIE